MSISPASILTWASAGSLCLFGNSIDLTLLILAIVYRRWDVLQEYLPCIEIKIVIDIAKTLTAIFMSLQVYRYVRGLREPDTGLQDVLSKPMFFPGRTAHTRLFPSRHSFSYSYLLVGVPVGWKGSSGGMISGDMDKHPQSWYSRWISLKSKEGWFTVNADDYLARGYAAGGLREKLDQFLQSQGEKPKDYPYAYLLTAARFLNYSSNPVSIWHLYSSSRKPCAVILEVNNTFDERHIYFLKPSTPYPALVEDSELLLGRFTQTWPKDFYVSVFNSRSGTYSMSAKSPLDSNLKPTQIDTTITLSSSKGHPKLIARIFNTSSPLDPSAMTVVQKTIFILQWWWVGLATFPRTIYQAVYILWKKSLSWVFRPEPRRNTMPRKADDLETFIEPLFRKYIRKVVARSEKPIKLRYLSAGFVDVNEEVMMSPSAQLSNEDPASKVDIKELEFKVLTPIFYSRFIRYTSSLDGINSETNDSSTLRILNSEFLSALDFDFPPMDHTKLGLGVLLKIKLTILQHLRFRPDPIENSESLKMKKKAQSELKDPLTPGTPPPIESPSSKATTNASQFGAFVISQSGQGNMDELHKYASTLLETFVVDHVAFGWVEIFRLELFIFKLLAVWALSRSL